MTFETECWLSPMVAALLTSTEGAQSFSRLMESALLTGAASVRGVNWVTLGQLLRDELAWHDYPAIPPQILN